MEKSVNDIIRELDESEIDELESQDPEVDTCSECGRPLAGCLEGWTDDGVCSGRCWAELFGEVDCE
jgi:hypothetical protein